MDGMECYKPDSVSSRLCVVGLMTIYLVSALPQHSSNQPEHCAGRLIACSACSCTDWGSASRACHHVRWWSLTPPFHPYLFKRRSAFCGTSLRITPSGCYPPSCPVVSGLSSTCCRGHPHLHPEFLSLANFVQGM